MAVLSTDAVPGVPAGPADEARVDGPVAPVPARRPLASRVRDRRADLLLLLLVAVVVAGTAQIPVLKVRLFYYWDDSAAVFLPSWRLIGEQLRDGSLPVLNTDVWMGGNWAGEAQLGIWNPVLMANAVVVSLLPDLAMAAILIKTEFLIILATGVYLLAREYGARRGAAAVVAVALPFSGYTLFWDAEGWAASLIAFAFLPHFWWTARRFARGRLHPVVPLVVGVLTMTTGSPYGALAVIVVLLTVTVERLVCRDPRSVLRLAIVGLAAGLTGALVFLPLLGIQPVSWRSQGVVANGGQLVPGLGQLLNLSAPAYVPPVPTFSLPWSSAPSTPMAYLAWFVVPLLPWFAWRELGRLRARVGVLVLGFVYFLLVLGPSDLWLFRWPARLTEYFYLPLCVIVAVLLSAGLRTDRFARRALLTAGLILVQTWLTWANRPDEWLWAVQAAGLVAGLVALTLAVQVYRRRLVPAVLIAGTVAVLAVQIQWFPGNRDVTPWQFPHNVAYLRSEFADRSDGTTITIGDPYSLPAPVVGDEYKPWHQLLFGNLNQVAGMSSLGSYTGMGNQAFSDALCLTYLGGTCPEGYEQLFATDPSTGRPLADLLGVRSVVVVNGYLPGHASVTSAPAGWQITKRSYLATTIHRTTPEAYPDGRVSWTAPTVRVTADRANRLGEDFTYTGGGRVILAALNWPGWHATVNGEDVLVRQGPAGLIELNLPPNTDPAQVHLWFWPTGMRPGAELALAGLVLGAGYCVWYSVSRRRRRQRRAVADAG